MKPFVKRALGRKLARIVPMELQSPLDSPHYDTKNYGGSRSLFPYTGAITEAAQQIATLICPPVNAPDPHESSVLRWPCEGCILWARQQVDELVRHHRADFPRVVGVVPDAEIAEKPRRASPKKSHLSGRQSGYKPRRKPGR